MEAIERRTGGPVGGPSGGDEPDVAATLGAPPSRCVGLGMLDAVPRWVLPRLARMGVVPSLP